MGYVYYINRPTGRSSLWVVSSQTPNFKEIVASGKRLPENYHLRHKHEQNCAPTQTYNGLRNEYDAGPFGIVDPSFRGQTQKLGMDFPTITSLKNEVTNSLLDKVRSTKIDLGVCLAEAKETAGFISSATNTLTRSALDVASASLTDSKKQKDKFMSKALSRLTGRKNDRWNDIPGAAANLWLAWSYGAKPLIKDVYDAVDAVAGADKQPYYEVSTVRSRKSRSVNAVSTVISDGSEREENVSGLQQVSGKVSFYVDNPITRSLDQLGLMNPAAVAYEAMTLSFVVDWFIPIGDFLANIVPPQGVSFVSGTVTSRVAGTAFSRTDYHSPPSSEPGWHTMGTVFEDWKERTVLDSIPSYKFQIPPIDLSISQAMSGVALLWSLLAEPRIIASQRR